MRKATELIANSKPKPKPILGSWLRPAELVLLYGERGCGKTYISLMLANTFASGSRLFGWEAEKRTVLYCDGEMGDSMPERITQVEASPNFDKGFSGKDFYVLSYTDCELEQMWNITDPAHQQKYNNIIKQTGAKVVVIDNYNTCKRRVDAYDNEFKMWERVQPWLIRLRGQGITVILVHHTNKSSTQSGSKDKENIVDYIVRLQHSRLPSREETSVDWIFEKRRHVSSTAAPDMHLGFSFVKIGETYAPRFSHRNREQAIEQEIRNLLTQGRSASFISSRLDIPRWQVEQYQQEETDL